MQSGSVGRLAFFLTKALDDVHDVVHAVRADALERVEDFVQDFVTHFGVSSRNGLRTLGSCACACLASRLAAARRFTVFQCRLPDQPTTLCLINQVLFWLVFAPTDDLAVLL